MKRLSALNLPGNLSATSGCSFATVALVFGTSEGAPPYAYAHIPFDFLVGEKTLAAGPYAVEPSRLDGMLMVRRADGDSQPVLVQAIGVPGKVSACAPRLLFYCQRKRYFLAQALMRAIRRPRRVAARQGEFPAPQLRLEKSRSCLR
jgi:hypothetical protein